MPTKLKRGGTFSSILVSLILLASLVGGAVFILGQLHLLPTAKQSDTPKTGNETFNGAPILRITKFKDSEGNDKRFIVVKSSEGGGIPIADTYITDKNFAPQSAIKIPDLSNDNSLAYAATTLPIGKTNLVIAASTGSGIKYIVVAQSVGDATTITIVDEKGLIVSKEVANKILTLAQSKCQCSIAFGSWVKDTKFEVTIHTSQGEDYSVQIDAKSGSPVDGLKKIKA